MKKILPIMLVALIYAISTPMVHANNSEKYFMYKLFAVTAVSGALINIANHYIDQPTMNALPAEHNTNLFSFWKTIKHCNNPYKCSLHDYRAQYQYKNPITMQYSNQESSSPTAPQKAWMLTKVATKGAFAVVTPPLLAYSFILAGERFGADKLLK